MTDPIPVPDPAVDHHRRRLLTAAGAGFAAASLAGVLASSVQAEGPRPVPKRTLRWGVVGTGGIANGMAPRIREAAGAELAAVSSRRMETAREFADEHGVAHAFDDWGEMIASDTIDAVYIATPTSVREEIGVAAARAGKHVLGEKPFASLASVQRIAAACREAGVGFMDGTHFVHEPRHHEVLRRLDTEFGWPWSVASAFQFNLPDTTNIRYNPRLEPMGAIGDAGWYNMKVASWYVRPGAEIADCDTYLRRHAGTGACIGGSGVIRFDDGSTTTFNCGFDSAAGVQDLRLSGPKAVLWMDDFLRSRRNDHAGVYQVGKGWSGRDDIAVPSAVSGATRMFEDFALMVDDPEAMEASIASTERAQGWLDTVWESALAHEARG